MTDYPQSINKFKQKALDSCDLMMANALLGFALLGGVGVAYIAGKTFGFVTGGVIFVLGLDSSRKQGDKQEIIEQCEIYAPFLEKKDFIEYKNLVGASQVKKEIEKAKEFGLSPKSSIESWLVDNENKSFSLNSEQFHPSKSDTDSLSDLPPSRNIASLPKNENATEDTSTTKDAGITTPEIVPTLMEFENQNSENNSVVNDVNEDTETEDEGNPFYPNNIVSSQLLIFSGSQGSGKTTRAGRLIELKIDLLDAFIVVLNPFSKATEWHGIPVAGRNVDEKGNIKPMSDSESYLDVEKCLEWFIKICEGRSQKQRTDENYDPLNDKHICIVLEEVTDWGSHINVDVMKGFWEKTLRTLRQLNLSCLVITHSVTARGLGGKATDGYISSILRQSEYFIFNSITNKNMKRGESPKIPSKEVYWKPANVDSKGKDNFEKVEVPGNFRPKHKNLDFRYLTDLDKFPDWRFLTGLKK